jgi:hypothetical protein
MQARKGVLVTTAQCHERTTTMSSTRQSNASWPLPWKPQHTFLKRACAVEHTNISRFSAYAWADAEGCVAPAHSVTRKEAMGRAYLPDARFRAQMLAAGGPSAAAVERSMGAAAQVLVVSVVLITQHMLFLYYLWLKQVCECVGGVRDSSGLTSGRSTRPSHGLTLFRTAI